MSDPLGEVRDASTIKWLDEKIDRLKQQRDEWKRKYEEELKLWEWLKERTLEVLFDEIKERYEIYDDDVFEYRILGADPDPREAVIKAMEAEING